MFMGTVKKGKPDLRKKGAAGSPRAACAAARRPHPPPPHRSHAWRGGAPAQAVAEKGRHLHLL
jgi:hypothetical protein